MTSRTIRAISPFNSVAKEVERLSMEQGVIVSPMEALRNMAPSVFTTTDRPGVSERYRHVTTSEIVSHLMLRGWEVANASEQRVRNEDLKPWTAHTLVLKHKDFLFSKVAKGDVYPTLYMGNSHNSTTAAWFSLGMDRCVCANGMMVRMGEITKQRFKHVGNFQVLMASIYEGLARLEASVDTLGMTISLWKNVLLDDQQRTEYYRKALALRTNRNDLAMININKMDMRLRDADLGNDMFTIYNVAQEHLSRGLRVPVTTERGTMERTLVRAITSPKVHAEFNASLFELTAGYAKEVRG